jgi:hypothetical protein
MMFLRGLSMRKKEKHTSRKANKQRSRKAEKTER